MFTAQNQSFKTMETFPIKFKSDWNVQFRLNQDDTALSMVITSSKGELYGHVSVVQYRNVIEIYDYAAERRFLESIADLPEEEQEYFQNTFDVKVFYPWEHEQLQKYLDENIF